MTRRRWGAPRPIWDWINWDLVGDILGLVIFLILMAAIINLFAKS